MMKALICTKIDKDPYISGQAIEIFWKLYFNTKKRKQVEGGYWAKGARRIL